MAVTALTYYRAQCDTCGAQYEDPGDEGLDLWEFPGDAVLAATAIGWHYANGTLTCPGCLRCEKCGEHPAWVGGPELDEPHRRILCEECCTSAATSAPATHVGSRHLTAVASTQAAQT